MFNKQNSILNFREFLTLLMKKHHNTLNPFIITFKQKTLTKTNLVSVFDYL